MKCRGEQLLWGPGPAVQRNWDVQMGKYGQKGWQLLIKVTLFSLCGMTMPIPCPHSLRTNITSPLSAQEQAREFQQQLWCLNCLSYFRDLGMAISSAEERLSRLEQCWGLSWLNLQTSSGKVSLKLPAVPPSHSWISGAAASRHSSLDHSYNFNLF